MIAKIPFGSTGHDSSRIIFGAAAIGGMKQDRADSTIELVRSYGINHFDVAASYGEAELRLADFLSDHRQEVFLASKTGDRGGSDARASIERSLTRMKIDQLDLIQFHNLAKDDDWETAMAPGGALEAALQAKDEGLVRFIGVTGHGTRIAEMHLKSLARFDFASVLLPYSHMSMQDPQYASEFEALYQLCLDRKIAMQTIKSMAKRRWLPEAEDKKFSWYEPLREPSAITNAVHWVLKRPGVFLNSTSDATLLKFLLEAASQFDEADVTDIESKVTADVASNNIEPLFFRGELDDVQGPNGVSR
ncbi:MAG: aryl-alcohol dehydrogenase-like predicted oxidoreductase [Candidatus Azotimanducaceae bacterium]|jgi:aryl-alcohol dehydrogenase-like predicted oxidoreductase